ncbi:MULTISPECIES: phosphopantetheine-binding protein [unclassified Streptomyces]|uniref:phosphopantetheine-binding protein n=1 Tax=unclassified Streptomyces TaxID=2593676 RepID=UPI0036E97313
MASREEVFDALVQNLMQVNPALSPQDISGETSLAADLGLDSFARVELLVLAEEALGLARHVDPRNFIGARTLDDLVEQLMATELPTPMQSSPGGSAGNGTA